MSVDKIVTVISPKSCTKLDTPFVNYFREELAKEIGEEKTEKVIAYTFKEVARMDEGMPETPIELDMANYGYPMLAVYRGLIGVGYSPEDVAASFQKTVVETLVEKTMDAARWSGMKQIAVAGGVAANSGLAAAMEAACAKRQYKLYRPDPILCTDNGAMIGCRAYYMAIDGRFADLTLNARPALSITTC